MKPQPWENKGRLTLKHRGKIYLKRLCCVIVQLRELSLCFDSVVYKLTRVEARKGPFRLNGGLW